MLIVSIFFASTVGLLSLSVQGWEAGSEYLYDYNGLLATALQDADHQMAAVQFIAKLTVQSIDDETLMLKMSEIRVTRAGNYSGRGSGRPPDPIWLPVLLADGEEEAVSDSLHLLSPFAVIHNKGSITNLVVENDEPQWSVNIKKAVASHLQTDVSGVRSGVDGGVFGERNAALNSLEDGVTGDCLTTLRITRLPLYQIIHESSTSDQHQLINEICRSTKIFEITKIKDFDQCRSDPLRTSFNPQSDQLPSQHGALQRFAASKYLACGDSSEKATIVRMEGMGQLLFSGPFQLKTEQTLSLVLLSHGQIRDILPSLVQPKILDGLTFSYDATQLKASRRDEETVLENLLEIGPIVTQLPVPDVDVASKLGDTSYIIAHFDDTQLLRVWERINQPENVTIRNLYVDCAVASGSRAAIKFILDLIERQELKGFQAVWTLMSCGHSVRRPDIPLLRKFVDVIRSESAQVSKQLRHAALTTAADLLHTSCVRSRIHCNPETQVITEELIPLLVHELESAQSSSDRLTTILALGTLGVDDVLLLLVPYIRGEDVLARIAAIFSLQRLMDSSPNKVIPLLTSLADNIAERPEIRMTAIGILLLHDETPLNVWKKIGARSWFEPSHQVKAFTCELIRSLADMQSPEDESISSKARSVLALVHQPCSGRSESEHYATVKGNSAGLLSLLAFWRLSDSSQPVYLRHQLFRQLGSFRFNLAQLSIWNYKTEEVWNRLFGIEKPQASGAKLNDIWDQLSLRFRSDDQQAGLFHVRLLGTSVQTFFNLDDIDRDRLVDFLKEHLNIRLVKFQQLVDIRLDVPTELGLPARFSFTLAALFSTDGSIRPSEINVTSNLLFKWTTESRIECPFSNHYVASGVDHRAELHAPIHLIFNNSLMMWLPPDRPQDLAYYHVKPYTISDRATNNLSGISQLSKAHLISVRPPSVSAVQLSSNLRLETSAEVAQVVPPSDWLNRFITGDFDVLELKGFQQRMYRLRYVPKDSSFNSVSLSSTIHVITIQQDSIDSERGTNVSQGQMTANGTEMSRENLRLLQGEIVALYSNYSTPTWSLLKFHAENVLEEGYIWNVSASGPCVELLRNWMRKQHLQDLHFLDDAPNDAPVVDSNKTNQPPPSKIHFKIQEPNMASTWAILPSLASTDYEAKCYIEDDKVITFDGVDYNYTINECHHLLTADCSQRAASFAVTTSRNESHGMIVRVTLDRNVIEVTSTGNVSINEVNAEFQRKTRMRILDGEKVVATTEWKQGLIHLRLLEQSLDISVEKNGITLSAGRQLLGRACGLCGDGDLELTGEFKTSDRCALSTGALMAASFQISVGPDECPLLPDELLQELLKESYPCYTVDEQVATVLPLPPES